MEKEIERKFIVGAYPSDVKVLASKEIHQTYLAVGKEEVRVRKIVEGNEIKYTMTVKTGEGLVREEIEFPISEKTYTQLIEKRDRKPLIKTRYVLQAGKYIIDYDQYHNGRHKDLAVAEVEFESEEEADLFQHPDWFREEVTNESFYKNQTLWREIQKEE